MTNKDCLDQFVDRLIAEHRARQMEPYLQHWTPLCFMKTCLVTDSLELLLPGIDRLPALTLRQICLINRLRKTTRQAWIRWLDNSQIVFWYSSWRCTAGKSFLPFFFYLCVQEARGLGSFAFLILLILDLWTLFL
jgi:hypothetical protein